MRGFFPEMKKNLVGRACVAFLLLLAATLPLHAQTLPSSLTPEQLQMFQNLSSEQQQAALNALRNPGAGTGQAAGNTTRAQPGAGIGPAGLRALRAEQAPKGPPRLKPSTVLLLSVDVASVCSHEMEDQQGMQQSAAQLPASQGLGA